jgi:hypothetical protein
MRPSDLAASARDRTARQMRWRLRRLRRPLRRPLVAWRHAVVEPADVVLASYPRAGSRWFEIMLGELLVGHEIDFYTRPYPIPFTDLLRRCPDTPRTLPGGGRALKTHERYRPEYRKAVYMVRHPGDAASSYYRQGSQWALPRVGFDRWFDAWIRGEIDGYGTWQENVESWLDAPIPVELIRYEELKAGPEAALAAALRLFGVERDAEAISRVVQHNSLDRMLGKLDAAERSLVPSELPLRPDDIPDVRGESAVWSGILSDRQRDLLERYAGRAMERLGYELAAPHPGPPKGIAASGPPVQ